MHPRELDTKARNTPKVLVITTGASNLNMLNDIVATASFLFIYLLLFQLFKYLDATVENTIFHLYLVARFNNGQYGLSSGFRGYKAIFSKFYRGKTFFLTRYYCQRNHSLMIYILVEYAIFHLYLIIRFDNGQYGLTSGFCGYEAILFEVLPRQNLFKRGIIASRIILL